MSKQKKNSSKETTPKPKRESNLNSDIADENFKLDSEDNSAFIDSNNFMDNEMMEPRSDV